VVDIGIYAADHAHGDGVRHDGKVANADCAQLGGATTGIGKEAGVLVDLEAGGG